MAEPLTHRAGDSISWSRDEPDHPPADGWVLSYRLVHPTAAAITIAAVASGTVWTVSLTPSQTAAWPAGRCMLVGLLTRASAERLTRYSAAIEILPDLATASTYDGRSTARKMLEAVEAALVSRASAAQIDMIEANFRDRGWKRSPELLIKLRSQLAIEVAREDAITGSGAGGRVYVRF